MLTRVAHRLVNAVIKDEQDEQQRAIYEYGCELWLYTVISTLGLMLIGSILGFCIESMTMIVVFYLCQSNGGGYHASTHTRCFLTMVIGLLLGLLFLRVHFPDMSYIAILLCSTVILLVFPLHLTQNKQHLFSQKDLLVKRSRLTTVCIAIGFIVLICHGLIEIAKCVCIAMLFSSVSRMFAIMPNISKKSSAM